LRWFASLADRAGCAAEVVTSDAGTLPELYAELSRRHGFDLAPGRVRVAVNGAFVTWDHGLAEGDEIVFVPPVSGG
jgi:molybdopterin converting factor small subunit